MTVDLAALERVLRRTALRRRMQRGLDALAWTVTCVALSMSALLWLHLVAPSLVVSVLLLLALLAGLVGAARPVSLEALASAIDRVGQLEGRVLAAVSFRALPGAVQTPFMRAALRDACEHAAQVSARAAVPLSAPRMSVPALLALTLCVTLMRRPVPEAHSVISQRAARPRPVMLLDAETENALREHPALLSEPSSQALREARAELASLLANVAAQTLTTSEAIARALALEEALAVRSEEQADERALADETEWLRALAAELARIDPQLARGLREDLALAARQLRLLAEVTHAAQPARGATRELAAALAAARAREQERVAATSRDGLLKREAQEAQTERSMLKKNEAARRLDTLSRQAPSARARALEKLERELARAGDALRDDQREQASQALQESSDAAEQLAQARREQAQRRALADAASQLREQLQQQALSRQREQEERARADREPSSAPGETRGPAPSTQSAAAERLRRFSARARGEREDDNAGASYVRGLAPTGADGDNEGEPAARIGTPAAGSEQTVSLSGGASDAHDSARLAAPTRTRVEHDDQRLRGQHGEGPTRSQVIRGAATSGFAQLPYRRVYGDYREHAEALLERELVPPGERFHVRHYFELVRPREGQATP